MGVAAARAGETERRRDEFEWKREWVRKQNWQQAKAAALKVNMAEARALG